MNIKEIMEHDIAEAERQRCAGSEREAAAGDECGIPWTAVCAWLAVALAALGAAFTAGADWRSRCDLKEQKEYHAWLDRVEREAQERVRGMSNHELLMATEKAEAVK